MTALGGELSGRRVLVTGATGFIGGRTVERLVEEGARVRVLIRNFAGAARISRFDIEIVQGEVTDPEAVDRATRGCDFVIHCAYGKDGDARRQREVNVKGTGNVLEAAARARVRRVIHLSTLMVYGYPPPGILDETAPSRQSGHPYGDSKLDAENLALEHAAAGLPVVVLQPTAVYGPFAPVWTRAVLARLRSGRVILIDGGAGICNAVFVDDLVQAILLAAISDRAVGERFLISGREPVTWREFYGRFEQMLGIDRTVPMTMDEAAAYYARTRRRRSRSLPLEILTAMNEDPELRRRLMSTPELSALRRGAHAALPGSVTDYVRERLWSATGAQDRPGANGADRPSAGNAGGPNGAAVSMDAARTTAQPMIHPEPPLELKLFTLRTRVSIEKARRLLGYEPEYDFERGMQLTEVWARWARELQS